MNDKDPAVQLANLAAAMSDEDLLKVIKFLDGEYRLRKERTARLVALTFKHGDWVEVIDGTKRLPAGARGEVLKIRSGTIQVRFAEHGRWNVAATLLRKLDGTK